jgi:antitoxin component of MazEF toxin-antitoxin module
MGYPTKIQRIQRNRPDDYQFFINIPAALADSMDFAKGEVVEWSIIDKQHLVITRAVPAETLAQLKKKLRKP